MRRLLNNDTFMDLPAPPTLGSVDARRYSASARLPAAVARDQIPYSTARF
jgi:hypothetical protein